MFSSIYRVTSPSKAQTLSRSASKHNQGNSASLSRTRNRNKSANGKTKSTRGFDQYCQAVKVVNAATEPRNFAVSHSLPKRKLKFKKPGPAER